MVIRVIASFDFCLSLWYWFISYKNSDGNKTRIIHNMVAKAPISILLTNITAFRIYKLIPFKSEYNLTIGTD